MNFIQQAYKGRNEWYIYLLVILVVFFGWQFLGVVPLLIAAIMHSEDMNEFTAAAQDSFMTLGINSNLFLFLMIFTFACGLLFLFMGVRFLHKRAFKTIVTSRKNIDWKRFWFGFITWGLISIFVIGLGIAIEPENYVWNFKPIPFFILVLISFLFIPIQTSFEELLFRGYLMQGLGIASRSKKFPLLAFYSIILFGTLIYVNTINEVNLLMNSVYIAAIGIGYYILSLFDRFYETKFNIRLSKGFSNFLTPLIITSVAFGLLHGANPEVDKLGPISMVFYIGTGFFFGIVTLLDEGTELALGLHAINNIVAAFFVTTDWTVFQTEALYVDTSEPSVGLDMFLPVLVLYPILLIIFSKKYGWKNWKEKLFGKIEKPMNDESIQGINDFNF
ncbi:CAAX protease self-immunity [Tenacibaculum sp. MAR_2009_124]|uniref:CPBP family glutamic-type intramembrane protease n=1 Tax=Tenacibaculum sp. MAR_2009_124 TaxID=1250059 RepID=UPI000896F4B8|nr:CPBP family glutamic-type intramembrane protease [Tenacibaculum sp. MAR_2009_124]SEC92121.1 CAAX protease self-immunity [Tenacibaculum sp. MAR_2009_124]